MKRKASLIINFIWVTLVVLAAVSDCCHGYLNAPQYTMDTHMIFSDPYLYAVDNAEGTARVYCIGTDGVIQAAVETDSRTGDYHCAGISVGSDVFVLLEGEYTEEGETRKQYRIARYSGELELVSQSMPIRLEDKNRLSGFSVEDDIYYLTVVDTEGAGAYVYQVSGDAATETDSDKEEQQIVNAEQILLETPESGRKILQAKYQRGKLLLYMDDGTGVENFVPTAEQIALFNHRTESVSGYLRTHQKVIFQYAVTLFTGLLVLVIAESLLRKRNRLTCLITAWETVLLLIAVGMVGLAFYMEYSKEAAKIRELSEVYLRMLPEEDAFAMGLPSDIEDYYNSEAYDRQYRAMEKSVENKGISDYLQEIYLVDSEDGKIAAGTGEWNARSISELYTEHASGLCTLAASRMDYCATQIAIGNRRYYMGCTPVTDGSSYVLVGVLSMNYDPAVWNRILFRDGVVALVLYVILSALGICFLTIQSRDIKKLNRVMQKVTDGDRRIERPDVHGKDMESMWNSINEADKALKKMNYSTTQIFNAYYRFVPKEIEKLLGRKSIMEVACGDVVQLKGNMAVVGADFDTRAAASEQRNSFVRILEKHRSRVEGVTVADNSGLSVIKILFPGDFADPVQFAAELVRDFRENPGITGIPVSVFLYRSGFTYGIAGTDTQCVPFLDTGDRFHRDEYAAWLKSMGLCVVMTEEIRETYGKDATFRYLGYITADDSRVKLYEMLDACPNQERRAKCQIKEKFEEALRLFYQYDFYLARSLFSEVLRELPQDRIAKWYLFTCEKYLNETYDEGIDCGLHYE